MIYRVSKFRLVFMNSMLTLIGLACLGASVAQVIAWTKSASFAHSGRELVVFTPIFALMSYWGIRGLLTMRGKDLRLEANKDGVTWVHMRGQEWAKWTSLDSFGVDPTRKTVMASVTGPDVSPKIAAQGVFTLSARLLDLDETKLAQELNEVRSAAVSKPESPSESSLAS